MGALGKLNNIQFMEFIKLINNEYAMGLISGDYDGLWVKDLPAADIIQVNKPSNSRGKTSHIAVTSTAMDLFPQNGENWNLVDIEVYETKISSNTSSPVFKKSKMAVREAFDTGVKHQVYLSNKHFDGIEFYSLREKVYVEDQMVILKKKDVYEYKIFVLDKDEKTRISLQRRFYYIKQTIRFDRSQFNDSILKVLKINQKWFRASQIYSLIKEDLGLTKEEMSIYSSVANGNRLKYKHIIDDILFRLSDKEKIQKSKVGKTFYYSYYDKNVDEYSTEAEQNTKKGKVISPQEQLEQRGSRVKKSKSRNTPTSRRYKTNPSLKKTALYNAKYNCEYAEILNENHSTFTSGTSGKQYMEGHHLIRMCDQEDLVFQRDTEYVSLDQIDNIVSLCPICHAKIHFGNNFDKKVMLKNLFGLRIKKLRECDLDITLEKLYELYLY